METCSLPIQCLHQHQLLLLLYLVPHPTPNIHIVAKEPGSISLSQINSILSKYTELDSLVEKGAGV